MTDATKSAAGYGQIDPIRRSPSPLAKGSSHFREWPFATVPFRSRLIWPLRQTTRL